MNKHFFIIILLLLFSVQQSFAQDKDDSKQEKTLNDDDENQRFLEGEEYFNPLSPAKAAFYSAIIPGLGQAYNKRYWKIPIIYGALATSLYYYDQNNTTYKRVRNAHKQRTAGLEDEFNINSDTYLTDASLESSQKTLKQNRDTSLLTFIGLYALQILEASIDAHLLQFNISDKVTFDPKLMNDQMRNQSYVGLSVNLKF